MRSSLFFLPFLAVLSGALGGSLASAFSQAIFNYVGWGIAASLIALWVALDTKGFQNAFQAKSAKYGASTGVTVLLGLLVALGAGYLSRKPRFNKSFDVTKNQLNTLDPATVETIKKLKDAKEKVTVIALLSGEEARQSFKDQFALYTYVGDVFDVTYIDPRTDRLQAEPYKPTSENSVIFQKGDREARITTFTEEKITNALVQTMKGEAKHVYFTSGHGESKLKGTEGEGLDRIVQSLEENKYKVEELSLIEKGSVPDNTDLLVIAGPKYDFRKEEMDLIGAYLDKGGALLVMVDAMVQVQVLGAFLEERGIKIDNDLLILAPNDIRARLIGQNNAIVSEFDANNPISRGLAQRSNVELILPNSRSLQIVAENKGGYKPESVAKTADMIIGVKDVRSQSDLKQVTKERIKQGEFTVIASATGKSPTPPATDAAEPAKPAAKEPRLVVVGSSHLGTNYGANFGPAGLDVFTNVVNFLFQDSDFVTIKPREAGSTTISLTSPASTFGLLFLTFIYPFTFLGGGIFYWLRRRRS